MIRRALLALAVLLLVPLRALAGDTIPPAILAQPSKAPPPGEAIVVDAQIVDESGVFDPTVYWRVTGGKEFEAALMAGDAPNFHATFAPPPGTKAVEYYIEAYDKEGNGPARFGAPTLPVKLQLVVAPPPKLAVAEPKPRTAPASKVPEKPAVPAAATAADSQVIEVSPAPPWQHPTALALAGAGVVGVVVGALVLKGARADAAAFNDRFARAGAFDEAQRSSIDTRQKVGVGLLGGAAALIAAGAAVYVIEF